MNIRKYEYECLDGHLFQDFDGTEYLFQDFDGTEYLIYVYELDQYYITYHQPNSEAERAHIRKLNWDEESNCWVMDPSDLIVLDSAWQLYLIIAGAGLGIFSLGFLIGWFLSKRKYGKKIPSGVITKDP